MLDKYIREIEIDTTINDFNLKEMQLKLPALKHKWIGRFIRHKQELSKIQKEKDKISKELIEKTIQQAPVDLRSSTTNVQRMVENTDTIKNINEKIEELKLILELLEKTEKVMSNMTFDFKNICHIIQMEQM